MDKYMNKIHNNMKNDLNPLYLKIDKKIGQGGFAEVYGATYENEEKRFAIKSIKFSSIEGKYKEINDEILNLEKITSLKPLPKSIPNYHGYYIDSINTESTQIENYMMVFDYFPQSLKGLIKSNRSTKLIDFEKISEFYHSLIHGLAFLQSLNICHRDLSPNNLMLDEQNTIKIIDYGISRDVTSLNHTKMEYELTIAGKIDYMAPEVLNAYFDNKEKVTE